MGEFPAETPRPGRAELLKDLNQALDEDEGQQVLLGIQKCINFELSPSRVGDNYGDTLGPEGLKLLGHFATLVNALGITYGLGADSLVGVRSTRPGSGFVELRYRSPAADKRLARIREPVDGGNEVRVEVRMPGSASSPNLAYDVQGYRGKDPASYVPQNVDEKDNHTVLITWDSVEDPRQVMSVEFQIARDRYEKTVVVPGLIVAGARFRPLGT